MKLANQKLIIIGGSSGMGLATAIEGAKLGAEIVQGVQRKDFAQPKVGFKERWKLLYWIRPMKAA